MRNLLRDIDSRWFAPAPAARPAVLRIAIGAYAFWYVWKRRGMLNDIAVKGDPNHYQPVGLACVYTGNRCHRRSSGRSWW